MAELTIAMDMYKENLKENFARKERLLEGIMEIIDRRWEDQIEQKLHGAAWFFNPQRFFGILESDIDHATAILNTFNEVTMKMFSNDENLMSTIDILANDYEHSHASFDTTLEKLQRNKKSPLDWWKSNGGLAIPLQKVAKRIVGLCCYSSCCERNWSTFDFLHTKKRNRLEFNKLNDLVYISYNKKITCRFQKLREQGNKSNSLFLEEFQWDNEWVDKDATTAAQVHASEDDLL